MAIFGNSRRMAQIIEQQNTFIERQNAMIMRLGSLLRTGQGNEQLPDSLFDGFSDTSSRAAQADGMPARKGRGWSRMRVVATTAAVSFSAAVLGFTLGNKTGIHKAEYASSQTPARSMTFGGDASTIREAATDTIRNGSAICASGPAPAQLSAPVISGTPVSHSVIVTSSGTQTSSVSAAGQTQVPPLPTFGPSVQQPSASGAMPAVNITNTNINNITNNIPPSVTVLQPTIVGTITPVSAAVVSVESVPGSNVHINEHVNEHFDEHVSEHVTSVETTVSHVNSIINEHQILASVRR